MKEPFLHQKVTQIVESQLKKLRDGRFPLRESAYALGLADPTRTLPPGTVCLVGSSFDFTPERDALLYRHPGLHPGDIRRVRVVNLTPELKAHLQGVDTQRSSGAIIFSTCGERSLADEAAGGDLDGDEFVLIMTEELVCAFPSASMPAWSEAAQRQALGQSSPTRPATTPLRDDARGDAAAWHMVRTRSQLGAMKSFANQWLLVAEAYGAADSRAIDLAYHQMSALDAGKMGGGAGRTPPEGMKLRVFPSHLCSHFKSSKSRRAADFTLERDTCLAKLQNLDGSSCLPECGLADMMQMIIDPELRKFGSPRYDAELVRSRLRCGQATRGV